MIGNTKNLIEFWFLCGFTITVSIIVALAITNALWAYINEELSILDVVVATMGLAVEILTLKFVLWITR
jgi:hypothetical protein